MRINPTQRTLAGYDIPAGYVLTADPRIAFLNGDWYPSPGEFRPERFLSAAADNAARRLHVPAFPSEQSPDAESV